MIFFPTFVAKEREIIWLRIDQSYLAQIPSLSFYPIFTVSALELFPWRNQRPSFHLKPFEFII
jgi:hypothetical protein